MYTPRHTSGFTLVEMVLATTIFGIMCITMLSIYIQTTSMSARIKATRYLSETSREVTERIADDIREHGIGKDVVITSSSHPYWNGSSAYTDAGTEILGLGDEQTVYLYGTKTENGIDPCTPEIQADIQRHCGLYVVRAGDYTGAYNLVDTFIPEESKKRVKIQSLRFYISGDGISTAKKVTLVMRLQLMPRIGAPGISTAESTLHIQTTFSTKIYQSK